MSAGGRGDELDIFSVLRVEDQVSPALQGIIRSMQEYLSTARQVERTASSIYKMLRVVQRFAGGGTAEAKDFALEGGEEAGSEAASLRPRTVKKVFEEQAFARTETLSAAFRESAAVNLVVRAREERELVYRGAELPKTEALALRLDMEDWPEAPELALRGVLKGWPEDFRAEAVIAEEAAAGKRTVRAGMDALADMPGWTARERTDYAVDRATIFAPSIFQESPAMPDEAGGLVSRMQEARRGPAARQRLLEAPGREQRVEYAQVTPQVQVTFTGDIREEADAGRIARQIVEEANRALQSALYVRM